MKSSIPLAVLLVVAGFVGSTLAVASSGSGDDMPVQYHEVTEEVGIVFQNAGEINNVADINSPWPAFPEIMGSGACWIDYDQDGYEDLYLVSQRFNDENTFSLDFNEKYDPTNKMFRNLGDGTFEDVTDETRTGSRGYGYGCSVADFDDDGDLDLFISNYGDEELLRNDDGVFTDISASSGIATGENCGDHPCMSILSAWADYDLDGDLDVFVGTYVDVGMLDGMRGPEWHPSQNNKLWRNNGDETFTEVAEAAGLAGRAEWGDRGSKSLGAVWFDADLDGDLDLYVANDLAENEFYVNQGDGTFADHSRSAGVADLGTSMGVTTGDYDQDGYPDLFFTHYSYQDHGFYRNLGDLTFEKRSGEDEQENVDWLVGWGTHFVDIDRDGDLDIHAAFGHTEPVAQDYSQPSKFYYNQPGDGTPGDRYWADVTDESGPGAAAAGVTRGSAYADYDLDGDTDIIQVNNGNQTAQFLRASGQNNHWLSILLKQPAPNIHGVGARVVVTANGVSQALELQAGSSYESQNSQRLDFGLGDALVADLVTVHWPGGGITEITDVVADQAVRIDRTLGLITDTLSPWTTPVLNGVEDGAIWQTGPITLTLHTVDRNVGTPSGVASVEYRSGDGPWQPYTEPLQFEETGVHRLQCRSVDNAGNAEPVRSMEIVIDVEAPEAAHDIQGTAGQAGWWVADDVEVELTATDDLSGVDHIEFQRNAGEWRTYSEPLRFPESGEHTLTYRAVDRAGNVGTTEVLSILVDHDRPNARIHEPEDGHLYVFDQALPGMANNGPVIVASPLGLPGATFLVEATASDDMSGLARLSFLVDGVVRDVQFDAPFTWAWAVADEDQGRHRLEIRAEDVAGNIRTRDVLVNIVS